MVDAHRQPDQVLACPSTSGLVHLFFTLPEAQPERMLQFGCRWYSTGALEFVSNHSVYLGHQEVGILVLIDRLSGITVYSFNFAE
ncbi:MAG TPA: hypothetical protein VKP88_05855 [Candidatus Paceibacterota bacterium]|nr:hypothetical protein [Candidatus Paceibacterota bacterium]